MCAVISVSLFSIWNLVPISIFWRFALAFHCTACRQVWFFFQRDERISLITIYVYFEHTNVQCTVEYSFIPRSIFNFYLSITSMIWRQWSFGARTMYVLCMYRTYPCHACDAAMRCMLSPLPRWIGSHKVNVKKLSYKSNPPTPVLGGLGVDPIYKTLI